MTRQRLSTPHTRKTLVPLLMVLALLLPAFTPSYSLAQNKDKPDKTERKVEKKVKLKPTKEAEVIIPDFEATLYDDGTRSVGASGSGAPGEPAQAFDFEVDVENGTYKTSLVNSDEVALEGQLPQHEQAESFATNQAVQDGQVGTLAIVPGTRVGKVRVVGKDPVFIVVNETTNRLEWTVYNDGTVTWRSYLDNCYAPSPSQGGTNWFVTSCRKDYPFHPSGTGLTQIKNWADGNYHNWDWRDPNQSTTASHLITLTGHSDGTYTFVWDYQDAGENYDLLRGTVYHCACW